MVTSFPAATPLSTGGGLQATLVRQTGYEDAPTQEEAHQSRTDSLGLTSITARIGRSAGYAKLLPGDGRWQGGGYRAEWHAMDHIGGPGTERWYGISYYFPQDYNQGSNPNTFNDRIIFQFTDEGSPMFSLHLDAAKQQLWVRRKAADGSFYTLGRWPFATDRWYDIIIHVLWSKGGDGAFTLTVDGVQQVAYTGRTLAVRDVTYAKWGIYGQPTYLLFDEVRIAEGKNGAQVVAR